MYLDQNLTRFYHWHGPLTERQNFWRTRLYDFNCSHVHLRKKNLRSLFAYEKTAQAGKPGGF
jgi:hypothetical protein